LVLHIIFNTVFQGVTSALFRIPNLCAKEIGGKQAKTKTLRNPQSFNYKVSHLRGHATLSRGHLALN
jgi:hypothetical protein